MPNVGPNSPSAASTSAEAPWDDQNWDNPTNVYDSDDARAAVNSFANEVYSHVLRVTGFDFAIDAGSIIDGILVEIEGFASTTNELLELCQLTKDGTTRVGDDYGTGQAFPTSESGYFASLGGAADLWGTTWSVEEINAPTFGVHIAAYVALKFKAALIDHVRISVTYTPGEPPAGNPWYYYAQQQ